MPYPSTGESTINKIIVDEYLKEIKGGFYIEAGACDGLFQSNTYFLETELEWTGILIEPNPVYYQECLINRPNSKSFNCALVPFDFLEKEITLYSIATKGAMGTVGDRGIWENEQEDPSIYEHIPARTLSSILDELNVDSIDFMSLDVEGYECNVLSGIDFLRHTPNILLVESFDSNIENVKSILNQFYYLDRKISDRDYIFISKSI